MSLKLSKNKVNLLTKLIVDYLEKSEEVDYNEDIGNIRLAVISGAFINYPTEEINKLGKIWD